jgi:hypothetical protein
VQTRDKHFEIGQIDVWSLIETELEVLVQSLTKTTWLELKCRPQPEAATEGFDGSSVWSAIDTELEVLVLSPRPHGWS